MHVLTLVLRSIPQPPPPPVDDTPGSWEDSMSWLLPVIAGLLLTAIACWKHRGLPGGH